MPKELTHLIVAQSSKERYSQRSPGTVVKDAVERHVDYFLFGAVMHDVSFCGSSTANGETVKHRGHVIHGDHEGDTLEPFRYLASVYDKTGSKELLSLIAGAVTHMMTDSVFHPFVYYYSGNDIKRHYRLETLLDTHLAAGQERRLGRPVSTLGIYKNLRREFDHLAGHLSGFLGLSESFIPEIVKALKLHDFVLKLFLSRSGYHLFRLISLVKSDDFKSKVHLFYPQGMRYHTPFFEKDFFYRNPVSGESGSGHVDVFIDTAVEKICGLCEEMGKAAEKRELECFFKEMSPVSLETGLDPRFGRTFRYTDLSVSIDRLVSGK
jgi:hypothetical protein